MDEPRAALAYQADDRSLLLPIYRRLLLDPIVPRLPTALSPNAITHAGHLLNLSGLLLLLALWPTRGWPLVVAALALQLYVWCDNADGAHARRTGQCSPYGELLDHGLDILNVVYIACMTALALGLPPALWVVVVLLITAAAAVTYWEQTQTGVFRLGMMSQLESAMVLSVVLCISAVMGTGWWSEITVLGFSPQLLLVLWPSATILFGIARTITRVVRARSLRTLPPVLALAAYGAAIALCLACAVVTARVALVLAIAGNVYFAAHMLTLRLDGRAPRVSRGLVLSTLGLLCIAGCKAGLCAGGLGTRAAPHLDTVLAGVAATFFALGVVRDARRGIARVRAA